MLVVLCAACIIFFSERKKIIDTENLREYFGVVDSIDEKRLGSRGLPYMKLGSNWVLPPADIRYKIEVDDSLVKKKGSLIVEVFRKDANNQYTKIFPIN